MLNWNWYSVTKFDSRAVGLYSDHYSSRRNGKSKRDWLNFGITAPGESMVLMTSLSDALFVWVKQQYRADNEIGVNCAVFRNVSSVRSSELILEAENLAWQRWPGERLFTHVDPSEVSANPGYCFKMAGWQLVKDSAGKPLKTSRGLILLQKHPPAKGTRQ